MNQTTHIFRTFCSIALGSDAKVPDWIELIPAGRFTGRDERVLINDHPDMVIELFNNEGIDLVFDYEHLSEADLEDKKPSPAAGWIQALENRDGAVWAKVDWTANARQMIAAKEYRYYSPALFTDEDPETGVEAHVLGLSSAGLVHSPYLRSAVLNSKQPTTLKSETKEGVAMKDGKRITLCQRLGLADEASDDAVLSAVETLGDAAKKADEFDPSGFVPKADYEKVAAKLAEHEANAAGDLKKEAEAAVNEAIDAEKIAPASKDYHLSACSTREGLDQFKTLMGTAGKLALTQKTELEKEQPAKDKVTTLSTNQKQIAKKMGLSNEDYLATLKAE